MKFKVKNKLFELTKKNKINPLDKIYRTMDFNNEEPFKSIKENKEYITNIKGDKEFNLKNFKNKLK